MAQFYVVLLLLSLPFLCALHASESLQVSREVAQALASGKPVVALESTIITHGMPYPENVQTALAVEQVVRDEGVTPATIAVVDGVLRVGLDENELKQLAQTKGVMKLSTRDLPYALTKKRSGGTTVAATMKIAELAGIQVFATGGIGGVHRQADKSFDVSADLERLARSPMIVVCAGAKSILDLPLTLEKLETLGVSVVGYQTDQFPAFYYRDSELPVSCRLETPEEVARFHQVNAQLGLAGATLLAVPVPESEGMDRSRVESAVSAALLAASEAGVSGKAVTPFLLDAVVKQTEGKSLKTNIALIKNNARVAAQVARSL